MKKLIICMVAVGLFVQSTTVYSQGIEHVCFANPRKKDLDGCTTKGKCRGVGTYAVNRSEKVAARLAVNLCNKEYSSTCELDYCERKQ